MSKGKVAIIGAGISGLAAARYLSSEGFEPVVFEAFSDLGGQWHRENPTSGVWETMRTNTSFFTTKYSDVQYPNDVKVFPRNGEVLDMMRDMVSVNQLGPMIRYRAEVTGLARQGDGYEVTWTDPDGDHTEVFDRAVVATGRFIKPETPAIPGIETFAGKGGVLHSHRYKNAFAFRDMNILVLGGSISSVEIASDQSMMGKGQVYIAQRRQRYVMPKMHSGVPLEFHAFTLEGALSLDTATPEELGRGAKEFLEMTGGNPARYGAPAPHTDIAQAGVTASPHFLNLMAEDRIVAKPWVKEVSGTTVTFEDGTTAEIDAIISGTGFDLHMPFLSDEIAQTINLTKKSMDLCNFTFHPDLPRLAFAGLWAQLGPYPVVLELQARWIAYGWAGRGTMPSEAELRQGVADCVSQGHHDGYREQHEMGVRFARLAGVMPDPGDDEELKTILPKCPVTGEMFRISGPDARPDAADIIKANFWRYADIPLKRTLAAKLGRTVEGE